MVNYDGKTFSQLKLDFRVENVDFKRESVKSAIYYGNVTQNYNRKGRNPPWGMGNGKFHLSNQKAKSFKYELIIFPNILVSFPSMLSSLLFFPLFFLDVSPMSIKDGPRVVVQRQPSSLIFADPEP